jgi:hypothetical protein
MAGTLHLAGQIEGNLNRRLNAGAPEVIQQLPTF